MAKDINRGFPMPINNLLECEITYLSRCNITRGFSNKIYNLKIINMDMKRPVKPTQEEIEAFTEKLDSFHESIIGKPTNNESFNVKYTYTVTKVVELDGVDRDRINTLLNDSNVKSINIVKNENTQHLVGTNQPYSPPQPKEYYVSWGPDSETEQTELTAEQFERFIKTAVINNKDISNFMVKRIKR